MAAKKPKAPKKFKQARKAAVADAKGAFSSGKTKAYRKDPMAKLSAEDKVTLKEVSKEAKGNYITDDKGNKVFQKPTETAQERFARDRREAKAAIDRKYGVEDKPAKTNAPAKAAAPVEEKPKAKKKAASKPAPKKAAVNKPATKGFAAGKTLNATGQARYDALVKEGVAPKKAMNKALFAQEKTTKAATPKMTKPEVKAQVKTALDKLPGQKPAKSSSPKYVQSTRTNTPATSKDLAVRPKTSTTVVGKAESAAEKVAKKGGKFKALGKKFVGTVLAAEAGSALKGSTEKDFRYIQKLENQLAKTQGKAPKYKNMGSNKNFVESSKADLSNLAALTTMGVVGKTRRERMDELNNKIKKAEKVRADKINKGRAAKVAAGKGNLPGAHVSSSKINKTYSVTPGAGGSTSTAYTVKRGDTLSGIAKTSGVKLSELLAANTKFKTDAKYKGGSMIWAGTKVKLPKK
jgi:LysM repeat protein